MERLYPVEVYAVSLWLTFEQLLVCFIGAWDLRINSLRKVMGIRRDILVQKHGLNERQSKAIEFLLAHNKLTIQDFEGLCPDVNRRSLQRDLKGMLDKKLLTSEGATNQLIYMLRV